MIRQYDTELLLPTSPSCNSVKIYQVCSRGSEVKPFSLQSPTLKPSLPRSTETEMEFSIRQFSSSLLLVRGTYRSPKNLPPRCFVLTDNSKDVSEVIYKMNKIFRREFQLISGNIVNNKTMHCFYAFMKAILSRFERLSSNPCYFQFMVLSSLAMRITLEVFRDLRCFTFVKVIELCLIAVFDRCYKDLFWKNEESETLGSYCERINSSLLLRDGRSQLPVDRHQQTISLLASLKDMEYESFLLTVPELKMLEDILDLVLSEGIPEASTKLASHSHFPWIIVAEGDTMEASSLDEYEDDSSGVNGIVQYCDGRCFNFVLSHMRENVERVDL